MEKQSKLLHHGPRRRPSFRGPPRRRLDGYSRRRSRRRPLADRPPKIVEDLLRRAPPPFRVLRRRFQQPSEDRRADDVEAVQERRDFRREAFPGLGHRAVRVELCGNQPVCRVPDSSLSHFLAMTRPSWFGRAERNRHRHAIEQASRRWRGGRRDGSARTRRKVLISTQAGTSR